MRKLTTLVATLLIAAATFAQAPQGFSYQAVVRDAQNAIVANQTVEVTVTILQGASADAAKAVFSEKHSAKTNANGLFTITVGSVDNAEFAKIDWGKGNSFLKTESAYGESTTQLMSVPYALYAANAGTVDKATIEQFVSNIDFTTYNLVNKTSLANYATTENVNTALASYTTTQKLKDTLSLYAKIEDLPEGVNLTGYAKTADVDATYAKKTDLNAKANTADLATVATSGNYNDLNGKPTLATVATTGSYNDLTNKPTIPTVPTATSQLTADKIGDMPMATVNVVITNVDNVATVSFLGKELTSGTTSFKIPAYSPVFLSVALSQYSRQHEDPTHYYDYSYSYTVKINGVDFDPVLGYYYSVNPTTYSNLNSNGKFDASGMIKYETGWGNSALKYPNDVTTDSDFQDYLTLMYYSSIEFRTLKTPIYKPGSGKIPRNPFDQYAATPTDAERNMVNQVVGPFPNVTNTIEIVVTRGGGGRIYN